MFALHQCICWEIIYLKWNRSCKSVGLLPRPYQHRITNRTVRIHALLHTWGIISQGVLIKHRSNSDLSESALEKCHATSGLLVIISCDCQLYCFCLYVPVNIYYHFPKRLKSANNLPSSPFIQQVGSDIQRPFLERLFAHKWPAANP